MADFLLEVGLEEVPARMLAGAQAELGARLKALLDRERLALAESVYTTYSTPRRLAVLVTGVQAKQADAQEELTGPAWGIAFKAGTPTPAAHAFAKKAGVAVTDLKPLATAKGEYASAHVLRPGRTAAELLAELLPKEIAALTWPKPMYWRAGKPERFVRPLQWIVALLDEEVVPFEFAGTRAANHSRGHRVLHGDAPVPIPSPAAYRETLLGAHVMADVETRRHTIRKALDRVTRLTAGARWREDEKLVDTVTHLTEWPAALLGSFASEYLALPEEVLVTVMRDHQKYFAVEDASGKLMPHFVTVLNTVTDEAGEALIRHGNERVLRARFNDAQFFWNFDQRISMEDRVELLQAVTFHKDLGTYAAKTERTRAIARRLADIVERQGGHLNREVLEHAVTLAKVDLTTELVKEFTELQGIVGALYVRYAGGASADPDAEAVAQAIYSQYLPASITDPTPPTGEGQILGLADRIGTIVDLFNKGLAPSGSRDPYALRRSANGVIKILAVSGFPATLRELLRCAFETPESRTPEAHAVMPFLAERLSYYLREVCRLSADAVDAVLAADLDTVADAQARGEALAQVRGSDDLAAIAAAWKRTKNILRQAEEKQLMVDAPVDKVLLREDAERQLHDAVAALVPEVDRLRSEGNYTQALASIATLRPYVDRFFEQTMVMVPDPAVRANRLALLRWIVQELGRIADFSLLTVGTQPVQSQELEQPLSAESRA